MLRNHQKGFTLVELLVVMAIIGVLIALLLPAIQKIREAGQRTQCQSQMRQIGIALHSAQDANGAMPVVYQNDYPLPSVTSAWKYCVNTQPYYGTPLFFLLPFIDQANKMLDPDFDNSYFPLNPANPYSDSWDYRGYYAKPPLLYLCPSDRTGISSLGIMPASGVGVSNYAFNLCVFGFYAGAPKVPSSFPDGSSTTALSFEKYGQCGQGSPSPSVYWGIQTLGSMWTYPVENYSALAYSNIQTPWSGVNGNNTGGLWTISNVASSVPNAINNPFSKFQPLPTLAKCSFWTTQSMHTPGMNVLMGDASVKLVSPSVSNSTWHAAITPNSKDVVGADW